MTSTSQSAARLAGTIGLAGIALFAAAPAYAHVAPDDSSAAGTSTGGNANKAQIEHQEGTPALRPPLPPKTSVGTSSNPSDPSSVPTILLAVVGGTLVAGGAGFTVYRIRHTQPVGAATA